MTMLRKIILSAIAMLVLAVGGKYLFGGSNLDTAYVLQGLSITTPVKYLVDEYWGNFGELPCKAGQLDTEFLREQEKTLREQQRAHFVLSAIDVTGCGQITLLYNEASGVPGRRMVLEAEERTGALGLELAWRCWTPDFPDIEDRITECKYEQRQLAEVLIPDAEEEESPNRRNIDPDDGAVVATAKTDNACAIKAALFRPVFTDAVQDRLPENQLVSFAPERDAVMFFTEVIGAAGKQLNHKWFFNDIVIGEYPVSIESDRWPTWSKRSLTGLGDGTLRVEVYDNTCLIGQASILSGSNEVADLVKLTATTQPKIALEKVLSDMTSDYASTADRTDAVDDLTDNGDTILLAAIRRGDTAEALMLINSVTAPKLPANMNANEARTIFRRYQRQADPFLKDPKGISPINLAQQLGHKELVEELILSAISEGTDRGHGKKIASFQDGTIRSLLTGENGMMRFDDGDTPLHRAVRHNNERAVLTMLRLTNWNEKTDRYDPPVNLYALDADGQQAMDIARAQGFYAIERFLALAMTRKSPDWAVLRSTFTTNMKRGEPADCRDAAFADEERLHFFSELSDMDGRSITHEWYFDRQLAQRTKFDVTGKRWSGHSSRNFSAADIGLWEMRVVSGAGEVLKTKLLHYQQVTNDNRRDRQRFISPCNLGSSALYSLVRAHAPISSLEYLLDKGTELKSGSALEKNLVNEAIKSDSIRLVGWFLKRGLDIEGYLPDAATPLLLAAKNSKNAMALFLITRGANVNFKRSRDGLTALHYAAIEWNEDLADILIKHGANPNIRSNRGNTPLSHAIAVCDAKTMSTLLVHGADPDLKNDKGETQRHRLAQCDIRESWDPKLAGFSRLYEN